MSNTDTSSALSNGSALRIRPLTGADVPQVAILHMFAFRGFFLTSLGRGALRELYSAMISDSHGIALVAEDDHRIVGFVAGAMDGNPSYRRLIVRRWWRFALAVAPAVLRHPALIARLAWRVRSVANTAASDGEALLSSVAVSPADQGRGAGRNLVRHFLVAAREKGARSVCLTTDAAENDKVERFYQSIGFRRRRAYTTPENRRIHEYVIDL